MVLTLWSLPHYTQVLMYTCPGAIAWPLVVGPFMEHYRPEVVLPDSHWTLRLLFATWLQDEWNPPILGTVRALGIIVSLEYGNYSY